VPGSIGKSDGLPSKPAAANDRAFVKKAAVVTKIGYEEILVWLKEKKGCENSANPKSLRSAGDAKG
jgi:hypothetical protein